MALARNNIGKYEVDEQGDVLLDTVSDFVHRTNTDSGSNRISGWGQHVQFEGHQCISHMLSNVFKATFDQEGVREVKLKLKGIVNHFRHSVVAKKMLSEAMVEEGVPVIMPQKGSDTRWGSTMDLFSWAADSQKGLQRYDINRMKEENKRRAASVVPNADGSTYKDHQLTAHDWMIVQHMVLIMAAPRWITDHLQSTLIPTGSLIMPFMGILVDKVAHTTSIRSAANTVVNLTSFVEQARAFMYEDLCRRCFNNPTADVVEDWVVATYLDPRFKNMDFPRFSSWLKGTLTKAKAVSYLRTAWNNFAPPPPSVRAPETVATPPKDSMDSMAASFYGMAAGSGCMDVDVVKEEEIDMYLRTPAAPPDTDPLLWWKLNAYQMPNVARMARQYLAMPASTAGVERVFSKVGRMHDDQKKSTCEVTLQQDSMARYAPL